MYHGLRKALAPGVSRAVQKDTRVAAVEEAFARVRKGIESLEWALDNCERTWVAQSEFCKYLPLIGAELYSPDDAPARAAISAATDAASALSLAVSSPSLAPVRSELSALLAHFKRLEELKAKWLNIVSDKAYYDDKYAKLAAILDKEAKAPTARDAEREKKALLKKAHTSDLLDRVSAELAKEFDACLTERLAVADKVFLAVLSMQSGNARRADFSAVHDMLTAAHFGTRHVPMPVRDTTLAVVLTGASTTQELRRSSSSDASSSAALSSVALSAASYNPNPPLYAPPQHSASTATYNTEHYATASSQMVPASAPVAYASKVSSLGALHHSSDHLAVLQPQPTAPHSTPPPPAAPTTDYTHSWQQQSARMQQARQAREAQIAQQGQHGQHAEQAEFKQGSMGNLSLRMDHLSISTAEELGVSSSAPPEPPSPTDSIFTYFVPGRTDADFAPKSQR